MNRKKLLLLIIVLAVRCFDSVAADRPNILWLTSEDHGPHLGCYGDALARSPHVDALAARGMLFKQAWSCVPVCAPARTTIITGLYASSSGGLHMRSMVSLPTEQRLFPEFLRQAGYYCTNHSKEDYNVRKPDGVWDESSAKAHWNYRRTGQPFFAVFNSTKSHESQIRTRPHQLKTDPSKVRVPAYHPDTPEVRLDWAQYYDKISDADSDAGDRLAEIDQAGLTNDTIVFYYADHGSGMPRSKRWPSNSGLHVPVIVYFPDRWRHLAPSEYQPNGQSDRLISFVDLAPTMLSLVGIKPPDWMQGHAFAGPFQTKPQEFLFGERGRMDERTDLVRSVTDGRYVYLRNFFPHVPQGQHQQYQLETPTTRIWRDLFQQGMTNEFQSQFWRVPKAPEELYDLLTDRDEVQNLATSPQHAEVLKRLRETQRAHSLEVKDVCYLPEGEIHSRSAGSTPYQMARDPDKYPIERIIETAERASNLAETEIPNLLNSFSDSDGAVRYWAVMGILMRGQAAVRVASAQLHHAISDPSPYVRIVAAEALGRFGTDAEVAIALAFFADLIRTEKLEVLVAIPALQAIDALGEKAANLRQSILQLDPKGPAPDPRFQEYVPRLVKKIGRR